LDHLIVFNEANLRRVLSAYVAYYNRWRPHRSLGQDSGPPIRLASEGQRDGSAHAFGQKIESMAELWGRSRERRSPGKTSARCREIVA
jgi:hypothetical protein